MDKVPNRTACVLIIDDDPVMRELLQALLTAAGYAVYIAGSGEAALERLRSGLAVQVILADVQLPGIAGPALSEQLRAVAPAACLLAMSGSEPPAAVRAAFDAFLLKPFSMEDFAALSQGLPQVGPPAQEAQRPPSAPPPELEPLDEVVYGRLAAALPAAPLAELYTMTLEDISARISRMREALAVADLETYRREAHALKGGCGMVGARELATRAAQAETAATCAAAGTTFASIPPAFERLKDVLAPRVMHNMSQK